jgi:SNF2 family DNA or RNA helicase
MRFSPREVQRIAIERVLSAKEQLIALRMGAGKSAVVLTALQELLHDRFEVGRCLIVAPKRVAELVWAQEAGKWDHTQGLRVERVLGTREQRVAALARPADVHVINVENFCWLAELVEESGEAWPWDMVVIDENRGVKDRASKTWKAFKRVRDQIQRLYLLTGTPTPNGLLELWPQVSLLDRGQRLGRSLTAYRDRWFQPDKRNGMVVYTWKLRPGAEQEIHEAVSDVMLSLDSDARMPERIDNIVPVAFDMRRYRELERTLVSGAVTAPSAGVLAGKLAQMANGAVYDDVGGVEHVHDAKLEALREIVEQGEPVLCLTTFRHDTARIRHAFPQAREFDGERSLRDWQAGKVPLLLMHPASGGHGVDGLQQGGRVAVWFGLPFSLDLYEQANARLHRPGQSRGVVIHHLVAQGTIDERVMAVLAAKGDVQQALLDAVKGLQQGQNVGVTA